MLNLDTAFGTLLNHKDADVREAAQYIHESHERRKRIMALIQEALSQLKLDLHYLTFDLECTRRERDAARGKL